MPRILGASLRRQEVQPPEDASGLADLVVKDLEGNDVRLGSLWEDKPAVLVWLRHYGWTFCRSHAVQLHRDRQKFEAAGVRLAVIGQGTPAHAAHFAESHELEI